MYQRFRVGLSKPRFVFRFVTDSLWRVFSYILILTLIVTIPTYIKSAVNSSTLFPDSREVETMVNRHFLDKGYEVSNNKLINKNNKTTGFVVGKYTYLIGDLPKNYTGTVVHLEEDQMNLYFVTGGIVKQSIAKQAYNGDHSFTSGDSLALVKNIEQLYIGNAGVIFFELFQITFSNLLGTLFIILFLTLLGTLFNKLPLRFKAQFTVTTYLATIWAVINMVLQLFGLNLFVDLALIMVIIYQNVAYKSAGIIMRIGAKKDEEE